jgi:hypothetical protein
MIYLLLTENSTKLEHFILIINTSAHSAIVTYTLPNCILHWMAAEPRCLNSNKKLSANASILKLKLGVAHAFPCLSSTPMQALKFFTCALFPASQDKNSGREVIYCVCVCVCVCVVHFNITMDACTGFCVSHD